jgi:hypothetical protein
MAGNPPWPVLVVSMDAGYVCLSLTFMLMEPGRRKPQLVYYHTKESGQGKRDLSDLYSYSPEVLEAFRSRSVKRLRAALAEADEAMGNRK